SVTCTSSPSYDVCTTAFHGVVCTTSRPSASYTYVSKSSALSGVPSRTGTERRATCSPSASYAISCMIRGDWPAGLGPCHHHRTSRPRLSYSTVSSAPPVVVLLRMTRHAFPFGPPSLVRDSVTVVCVPSGRVSSPKRPKPSYARLVTSWLGSVSL